MTKEIKTDYSTIPSLTEEEYTNGAFVKVIAGDNNIINIIDIDEDFIRNGLASIYYSTRRESYLLEAVKNFIRKTNYTELNESLEDGEISEDEYNSILEQNIDKYVISLKDIDNPIDVLIITDIINQIGYDMRDFMTDEISEMFSIKENQLISSFDSIRNQIK